MTRVAAPADKRFRRAHVKPGRRRRDWRRTMVPLVKSLAIAALLIFGLHRASALAAQAHMLRVDRIIVHGNQRLSRSDVVEVLNGLRGESLIWTDLGAWRKRLMASPWVRDAALRRSLPSTIDVVSSERAPVGIGRIHGEMYLVDDRGSIIDQYGPRYSNLDLPIIDGLAIRSNDAGLMTDEARAELAARVIQAIAAKPDVARKVSQIDVTDLHNATVILNDDGALIQLGEDQFLQRIESYLDLAATLRERVADIDYVDLRFDDRIYVRPAAKRKAVR
jgi:cell division protein FtsQ